MPDYIIALMGRFAASITTLEPPALNITQKELQSLWLEFYVEKLNEHLSN